MYNRCSRSLSFPHTYFIAAFLCGISVSFPAAADTTPPPVVPPGKTDTSHAPIVPAAAATPPPAAAPAGTPAPKSDPTYLEIDLATGSEKSVIDAGQYTLKYINQLPLAQYSRSTKLINMSIPAPFDVPGASTTKAPNPTPFSAGCDVPYNNLEKTLNAMMCESQVAQLRATAASTLNAMGCNAKDIQQYTAKFAALTEYTSPNPLPALASGDQLTVSVQRGPIVTAATQLDPACGMEKMNPTQDGSGRNTLQPRSLGVWEFDVGKQEAQWLTYYGFNFAASGNEDYFSKTNAGATPATYTITRKNSTHGSAFSASVYFMRLPAEDGFSDWSKLFGWRHQDVMGGVTAGVGFDFDNPTLFLGYGVGWGYNVVLTAGLLMHKEDRLNGQYSSGQVISENLTADQLTESTYKPRAYVGVAFRFGSNPFSSKSTPAPAATPKPATTTGK